MRDTVTKAFDLREQLERARLELVAAMANVNAAGAEELEFAARRLGRAELRLAGAVRRASKFLRVHRAAQRGGEDVQ